MKFHVKNLNGRNINVDLQHTEQIPSIHQNSYARIMPNDQIVQLRSKIKVAKSLVKVNKNMDHRFRLMPIDLEDMTNSRTLALDKWNNESPNKQYMMDLKKAQRRKEYWQSKVRADLLPKLNMSHDAVALKRRKRFKL